LGERSLFSFKSKANRLLSSNLYEKNLFFDAFTSCSVLNWRQEKLFKIMRLRVMSPNLSLFGDKTDEENFSSQEKTSLTDF
jgi:hypothetical protein